MKQTAVQWFASQLGITSGTTLEKANQMFREQIIESYDEGDTYPQSYLHGKNYYERTYADHVPDVRKEVSDHIVDTNEMVSSQIEKFSLLEHKETITSSDTITSSQTEISDEEIEKEATKRSWDVAFFLQDYERGWIDAIKWYREQLKKKQ